MDHHDTVQRPGDLMATRTPEPLYARPMPGGGSVRVELLVNPSNGRFADQLRGRVIIDPAGAMPQLADQRPVVVEEVEGDDPAVVVAELLRIARDNAAIARRVMRVQGMVPRAD